MEKLERLRKTLLSVSDKVFYAINEYDNSDAADPPFLVYQTINKRAPLSADNKPVYFESSVQITLVTKDKNLSLERELENALLSNGYWFEVTSEYRSPDKTICRVYEVRLEEI